MNAADQALALRRPSPLPGTGRRGAVDPRTGPGENPGVAATELAIPCRFENDFGHELHSTGLRSIRQLAAEGEISGESGLEPGNCAREPHSTTTKAELEKPNGLRRVQIADGRLAGPNQIARQQQTSAAVTQL